MPNINPPADAATAEGDAALVYRPEGGGEVRIGPRLTAPTQPDPCDYRFGIVSDGTGRRFAGYLWETEGLPAAAATGVLAAAEDAGRGRAVTIGAVLDWLARQPGATQPFGLMEYKAAGSRPGVTHLFPARGGIAMPCCGRTPLEVPDSDRITDVQTLVTCTG